MKTYSDLLQELSIDTLKGYMSKVGADSMKHKADPSKRKPEKASRSVAGFAKAFTKIDNNKRERHDSDFL